MYRILVILEQACLTYLVENPTNLICKLFLKYVKMEF